MSRVFYEKEFKPEDLIGQFITINELDFNQWGGIIRIAGIGNNGEQFSFMAHPKGTEMRISSDKVPDPISEDVETPPEPNEIEEAAEDQPGGCVVDLGSSKSTTAVPDVNDGNSCAPAAPIAVVDEMTGETGKRETT